MEKTLFVPGRVCLFGEHSDWAGGYGSPENRIPPGYTLLTGTNQGISARISPEKESFSIESTLPDGTKKGPEIIGLSEQDLRRAAQRAGFFNYAAGVAYYMVQHFHTGGIRMDCRMDLPLRKGLSSSAAICVLTARAFNQLYDLGLSLRDEMEYAYMGEILTGSQCGRMDQGCAFGQSPILMTFNGNEVTVKKLKISHLFYLIIADLGGKKDTRKILSGLNAAFLSKDAVGEGVREYLGTVNKHIVERAVSALEAGDPEKLGLLMQEAQNRFDTYCLPACSSELTAPRLHNILGEPDLRPFIWGGKGVGSQGDGTVQLLARGKEERLEAVDILQRTYKLSCYRLDIRPTSV